MQEGKAGCIRSQTAVLQSLHANPTFLNLAALNPNFAFPPVIKMPVDSLAEITRSADPVSLKEFEKVIERFTNELPATERIAFSQAHSISAVYEEVYLIQQTQEKSKALRYLNRLKPFLDGLDKYSRVIDTFISVKPELMAYLWVGWWLFFAPIT